MKKLLIPALIIGTMLTSASCRTTEGPTASVKPAPAWTPLLNGTDLTGWMDPNGASYDGKPSSHSGSGWQAAGNTLTLKGKGGNIWTRERYGDFVLDLELNTTGNSGILLRCDNPRSYVQTCIEVQVEKQGGPGNNKGFGAVYDCLAPSKAVGGPGWHHVTVTCKDNLLKVVIDGDQVIDMDLDKWDTPNKNPDGSRNKFKKALKDYKREGHIGLQDHRNGITYRNIRIRKL